MLKTGDKLIHRYYGNCTLIREADFDGECIVVLDKPIKLGFSEISTHESLLRPLV